MHYDFLPLFKFQYIAQVVHIAFPRNNLYSEITFLYQVLCTVIFHICSLAPFLFVIVHMGTREQFSSLISNESQWQRGYVRTRQRHAINYQHDSCFVVFSCVLAAIDFTEIIQNLIQISLKRVPSYQMHNKPMSVLIMVWHWTATSHYLNQCWRTLLRHTWTYDQIHQIACCACAGNAGNVFPPPTSKKTAN